MLRSIGKAILIATFVVVAYHLIMVVARLVGPAAEEVWSRATERARAHGFRVVPPEKAVPAPPVEVA